MGDREVRLSIRPLAVVLGVGVFGATVQPCIIIIIIIVGYTVALPRNGMQQSTTGRQLYPVALRCTPPQRRKAMLLLRDRYTVASLPLFRGYRVIRPLADHHRALHSLWHWSHQQRARICLSDPRFCAAIHPSPTPRWPGKQTLDSPLSGRPLLAH